MTSPVGASCDLPEQDPIFMEQDYGGSEVAGISGSAQARSEERRKKLLQIGRGGGNEEEDEEEKEEGERGGRGGGRGGGGRGRGGGERGEGSKGLSSVPEAVSCLGIDEKEASLDYDANKGNTNRLHLSIISLCLCAALIEIMLSE